MAYGLWERAKVQTIARSHKPYAVERPQGAGHQPSSGPDQAKLASPRAIRDPPFATFVTNMRTGI